MVSRLKRLFSRENKDLDCGEITHRNFEVLPPEPHYIDEDLEVSTVDRVKGHLERCGPCNAFVNTLRATVRMLGATPREKAPDGFRESVRERLKAETRE